MIQWYEAPVPRQQKHAMRPHVIVEITPFRESFAENGCALSCALKEQKHASQENSVTGRVLLCPIALPGSGGEARRINLYGLLEHEGE